MILIWLILIPFIGGLLAWFLNRWSETSGRVTSLIAMIIELAIVIAVWVSNFPDAGLAASGLWIAEFNADWIPAFGIGFHFALDGLSLLLVTLTALLGIMSVVSSWEEIRDRVGFFHFNLLATLSGIIGVFLSLDLFLFYFFWELMLVPMSFLIALWGHERRVYAAVKFFIFTQLSGLLMLAAILGLFFIHHGQTGMYTFDYMQLLGTSMDPASAMVLMLGFFVAFAVKLPVVPFHTWLPDAHTEAPTAGSVLLAGLLLKTGAYGLLRFAVPLFPGAALAFTPVALVLGAIGILYGAVLAFAQTDMKRLVAYTSISHMGFVLLGIFAWNALALQGAVVQIVAHGISTGALFMLVGSLQDRIHTRDLDQMGGLWTRVPRMAGIAMFFALASLGLPGLGNFIGEFLVLLGAFRANIGITVVACLGFVLATIYSLWMIQRSFFGREKIARIIPDLSFREMSAMSILVLAIIWIGLFPQTIIKTATRSIGELQKMADYGRGHAIGVQPEKNEIRNKESKTEFLNINNKGDLPRSTRSARKSAQK